MDDYFLRQTELRYAVHQYAAGEVERLEYLDFVTRYCEVCRRRNAGRAAADNRHAFACGGSFFGEFLKIVQPHIVGRKAFERADCHRLAFYSQYATAFALAFLRTHSPQTAGSAFVFSA